MEIPQNTQVDDRKEKLIADVVKAFEKNDVFQLPRYTSGIPLSIARDVAREFVSKGYHAKITHFCDHRAEYQYLTIAKHALNETNLRMVYSEMIG